MAAETLLSTANSIPPSTITSVKKLSESLNLKSLPSNYAFYTNPVKTAAAEPGDLIPVIDLLKLNSNDLDQRSRALHDLDKACQEWGFFMVVNHGIPEQLIRSVLDVINEFFNLPEEEKPEFEPKNVLEPIRYGTSFNTAKEKIFCWRDFLKVFVHPEFHCPDKPESMRSIWQEYLESSRQLVRKLCKGISRNLGLEENEMEKTLNLSSGLQIFIANLYPRCPNPDAAVGMMPHSDHGLLTLLIQNGVGGLQIQHGGKWVNVDAIPNSILVNTGDQLEIFSNCKYKSVLHRVAVNNEKTRISIAIANGPSPETVVIPPKEVVESGGEGRRRSLYAPMKYMDFLRSLQSNVLQGKSILEQIRIQD